jgi:hypothetical protein
MTDTIIVFIKPGAFKVGANGTTIPFQGIEHWRFSLEGYFEKLYHSVWKNIVIFHIKGFIRVT